MAQLFVFGKFAALAARSFRTRKTLSNAEKLLSRSFMGKVQLRARESFHGVTLRCDLRSGNGRCPTSVIVKQVRLLKKNQKYEVGDDDPQGAAYRLFNDWAGLEFLSGIAEGELAPRLLAGHRERGFLVLEDVGEEDFGALLLSGEVDRSEAAALQFARTLGKMHALSAGRSSEFEEIRSRLGPKTSLRSKLPGAEEWFAKCLGELRDNFAGLGFEPSPGFYPEMGEVAAAISSPGPFLVYTHGDPCPDNLRLSSSGAMLIDFEFGRFRHALTDGVYARMLLPTCWQVNRLPRALVREMERAYREELVAGCPEAADDRLFHKAILDACAFWLMELAVALRKSSKPEGQSVLEKDQQRGSASHRQILLARLEAFCEAAEEFGEYPALCATFRHLEKTLRRMWGPLDELALFPTFRQAPS